MRKQALAVIAVGLVLAASPLLAQETTPASSTAPSNTQVTQSGQNTASPDTQGNALEVLGTITSISSDRLELKVEAGNGTTAASSSNLIGKTVSFSLSTSTDMPAGLRTGDRVSVSFNRGAGTRQATRVALAETSGAEPAPPSTASSTESGSATSGSMSSASTSSTASTTGTSTTSSTLPSGSANQTETATSGAHAKTLPKTASQLPLLALIGVAALVAAAALRFLLRAF